MSEDVARLAGSEGPTGIMIGGKLCTARPLTIKELGELERACLKLYRQSYVSTFVDGADALGYEGEKKDEYVQKAVERAARWDVHDLPIRKVFDPDSIKLTDKLRAWADVNCQYLIEFKKGDDSAKRDKVLCRVISTMLDSEGLTLDQYREFTGAEPVSIQAGYASWWTTATADGRMYSLFIAFKHNGVTMDDVGKAVSENPGFVLEMVREIEKLSVPQAGNTSGGQK